MPSVVQGKIKSAPNYHKWYNPSMTFLLVLGIYFAILFVVGLLSRKSLGISMLALVAGATLARLWADDLTPLIAQMGISVTHPPLTSIVAIVLTLAPALVVLVRSPKVSGKLHMVMGSLVWALLAVVLTYGAFENGVVLDEASRPFVAQFTQYVSMLMTVGIVLAVGEILFRKKHVALDKHHKNSH